MTRDPEMMKRAAKAEDAFNFGSNDPRNVTQVFYDFAQAEIVRELEALLSEFDRILTSPRTNSVHPMELCDAVHARLAALRQAEQRACSPDGTSSARKGVQEGDGIDNPGASPGKPTSDWELDARLWLMAEGATSSGAAVRAPHYAAFARYAISRRDYLAHVGLLALKAGASERTRLRDESPAGNVAAPALSDADEKAWLIELNAEGAPTVWLGRCGWGTPDAAVRFSREQDARDAYSIFTRVPSPHVKFTEHTWCAPAQAEEPTLDAKAKPALTEAEILDEAARILEREDRSSAATAAILVAAKLRAPKTDWADRLAETLYESTDEICVSDDCDEMAKLLRERVGPLVEIARDAEARLRQCMARHRDSYTGDVTQAIRAAPPATDCPASEGAAAQGVADRAIPARELTRSATPDLSDADVLERAAEIVKRECPAGGHRWMSKRAAELRASAAAPAPDWAEKFSEAYGNTPDGVDLAAFLRARLGPLYLLAKSRENDYTDGGETADEAQAALRALEAKP